MALVESNFYNNLISVKARVQVSKHQQREMMNSSYNILSHIKEEIARGLTDEILKNDLIDLKYQQDVDTGDIVYGGELLIYKKGEI